MPPQTKSSQEESRQRPRRVFLVSPDEDLRDMLEGLSLPFEARWYWFDKALSAVEMLFVDPPELLVVDGALTDMSAERLVALVKGENIYRSTPVVLVLDPEDLDQGPDWSKVEADEFLLRRPRLPFQGAAFAGGLDSGTVLPELPLDPAEAAARLALTMERARRTQDTNPLTLLPGNTTIMQAVTSRIESRDEFALCYADLDHFKAFNDKYGFARGDEVLRMSARLLVNTVRVVAPREGFVGHVGGDDFVFIVPATLAVAACERFIASFDSIVPGFYDSGDRERGTIASIDRQGQPMTYPLMAVSIAVVVNYGGKLAHYGEASSIASDLKKRAKAQPGSNYVLDQRRG